MCLEAGVNGPCEEIVQGDPRGPCDEMVSRPKTSLLEYGMDTLLLARRTLSTSYEMRGMCVDFI